MQNQQTARLELGPMTVEPLGHIVGRGYVLSIKVPGPAGPRSAREIRVYASEGGKSLRAWAVHDGEPHPDHGPGNELIESDGYGRGKEPWWLAERDETERVPS